MPLFFVHWLSALRWGSGGNRNAQTRATVPARSKHGRLVAVCIGYFLCVCVVYVLLVLAEFFVKNARLKFLRGFTSAFRFRFRRACRAKLGRVFARLNARFVHSYFGACALTRGFVFFGSCGFWR